MKAARHSKGAQKRHQQGALRVALPIAIGQHPGRRQRIIGVVTEQDFVADKVIGGTDTVGV